MLQLLIASPEYMSMCKYGTSFVPRSNLNSAHRSLLLIKIGIGVMLAECKLCTQVSNGIIHDLGVDCGW